VIQPVAHSKRAKLFTRQLKDNFQAAY